MPTKSILVAMGMVLAAGPAAVLAQPYQYLVTDLGALAGPQSVAFGMNNSGQVVGYSTVVTANIHAFVYNNGLVDLGTVGADPQSIAYAVNDAGQVAGISYGFGDLQNHAVLWQGGVPTVLGNFAPRDINGSGVIVGYQTTFVSGLWLDHACRWSGGVLTDLGTLGGGNSYATAADDGGRIVGQSFLADELTLRATLWQSGAPHDLGTLSGAAGAKSAAADINNNGQVVGWSDTASGMPHAFLAQVDAAGSVTTRADLGALGSTYSYAYAINAQGVVVGTSNSQAVRWIGGQIADLNALIPAGSRWQLARAMAINGNGAIVGEGFHFGFPHAFLLTPVACIRGDVNGDGTVDGADVQAFVQAVIAGAGPQQICAADLGVPADGVVTEADIGPFVLCLLGIGNCN